MTLIEAVRALPPAASLAELQAAIQALEDRCLGTALDASGGNLAATARLLEAPGRRTTIQRMLERHPDLAAEAYRRRAGLAADARKDASAS